MSLRGVFLNTDGSLGTHSELCISDFIKVEPNAQYYISHSTTGGASNFEYDENAEIIGTIVKSGVFTTSPNARYVRLSVGISTLNKAQLEKGSSPTSYEEYTDDYYNQQKLYELQKNIELLQAIIPPSGPGKNLFDKDSVVTGYLHTSGIIAQNADFVTSDFIPVKGGKTVTAYPLALGPIYFSEFDSDKTFIKGTVNKQQLTIALSENCAFIRATFLKSNYEAEAQIEYGDIKTEYEPYHLIIDSNWLPENVKNAVNKKEVADIISEQLYSNTKLILPSTLYANVDTEKRCNIYIKQAIKCSCLDNRIGIRIYSTDSGLKMYDRQLSGLIRNKFSVNERITVLAFNRVLDDKTIKLISVEKPQSAKQVKILDIGDSISDLGGYQAALKKVLENSNVSVEYIGTMINRVNIGSSQSPEYMEGIFGEVLSGGNMGFITEASGAAKILSVSGISELPVTGYPGTSYNDKNGNSWVVRGFKVTRGEDGKYSGKLKIGKFKSDPNYGDGTSDDTSGVGNFPSSGVITKTNALAGDDTILYSSFDDARFNPFWNPATDELDFQYYFSYWGFDIPDIFIMQWGYNEVSDFDSIDSDSVLRAVARAKQIIDKFHSQYQNTKIIFGLEMYGREIVSHGGSISNSVDGKKYAILSMAEKFIEAFETNEYKDFVTLVPLYALMDHINGYGPYAEIQLCDLYTYGKNIVGQNGLDGVHPSYKYGLTEIGRAYAPYVLHLLE